MLNRLRSRWATSVPSSLRFSQTCSQARCTSSRVTRLWRRRAAIRIGTGVFCSAQCAEREIEQVLQRLVITQDQRRLPYHRMPLGLLLLSRGLVSETQLRTALSAQRNTQRGKIGEWLQQLGFVTEKQVVTALALQWGCPVVALPAEMERYHEIPFPMLHSLRIVPLRFIVATRTLYIASCTQVDHTVLYAFEHMLDCQASACVVSDAAMDRLLQQTQMPRQSVCHLFERMAGPVEMARIAGSYIARTSPEEIRIVKCGPYIWLRLQAPGQTSDVLFTPCAEPEARTQHYSFPSRSTDLRSLIAG
jgi:hypothetical protein